VGHKVADDPERGWFGVITIPAQGEDRVVHVGDLRPVVVIHPPQESAAYEPDIF
jgi:hypothetical protein